MNDITDLDGFDAVHDDPMQYAIIKDRVLRRKLPTIFDGGEAKFGEGVSGTTVHKCDPSLGGSQYRYS
jgi:hypothetical protein